MDYIQYIYITTGILIYFKLREINHNQVYNNERFLRLYNKVFYGISD